MCRVQLHKSSKSVSYQDMAEYSVPARIVTTAYSSGSSGGEHQEVHIINVSTRRSSVHDTTTTAVNSSSGYPRAQCKNTMASSGPEGASYFSSRGAAYHRRTEKLFYGRDSGEPLLSAENMGSEEHSGDEKSLSDSRSIRSITSATQVVNGSVIVRY